MIRVTIGLTDLLERGGAGGVLDSGVELTVGQLRRLAAEAAVIPFVLGGQSEILDQGRARRLATPQQREALILRDKGCIFPGCGRPPEECEAHHVDPFRLGAGHTDVKEMVLLCKTHHAVIEPDVRRKRDQWRIEFDPEDGRPRVVPRGDSRHAPLRHCRGTPNSRPASAAED